eukprot:1139303-Pelagomonas_calceolata.AAC.1
MEQPFIQQACVQDVSDFLLQHNNKLFSFVPELMDIMLTGEDQSQAEQLNSLAEGPPYFLEDKGWWDSRRGSMGCNIWWRLIRGGLGLCLTLASSGNFCNRCVTLSSPLLFSIYPNDINEISEDSEGAYIGAPNFHVSNLLYADDLCLTSNTPNNFQAMLNHLKAYARRKFLTVNIKTSVIVCFKFKTNNLPPLFYDGEVLPYQIPFVTWGCSLTNTLICTMLPRKLSNPGRYGSRASFCPSPPDYTPLTCLLMALKD